MTIFENAYEYMDGEPVEEGIARRENRRIQKKSENAKKLFELNKELDEATRVINGPPVVPILRKMKIVVSDMEKEIRQIPDDDLSDRFLGFFTRIRNKRKWKKYNIVIPDEKKALTRNMALENIKKLKKGIDGMMKLFNDIDNVSFDNVKFKDE